MITDVLHRLANYRQSLTRAEARAVMTEVLTGKCTDAQIAALLVALHMKGETVEEIVGFAEAIRAAATPLALHGESVLDASGTGRDALVDTCGTGGDASGTFNISTATAFVAAGAGVRVAKHGNRSVTSKCGSADVMEALGVNINLPPARLAACLDQVGIAFLFAPAMHSAMKYVQPVRRDLRLRTVFNLLGPLTNPAQATCQVVGVYSADLVEKLAEALSMLGLRRALVVHGSDGLDEITLVDADFLAEVLQVLLDDTQPTGADTGAGRVTWLLAGRDTLDKDLAAAGAHFVFGRAGLPPMQDRDVRAMILDQVGGTRDALLRADQYSPRAVGSVVASPALVAALDSGKVPAEIVVLCKGAAWAADLVGTVNTFSLWSGQWS